MTENMNADVKEEKIVLNMEDKKRFLSRQLIL